MLHDNAFKDPNSYIGNPIIDSQTQQHITKHPQPENEDQVIIPTPTMAVA